MPLKFLADHCVPDSIIRALAGSGHDVCRLRECLATDASDSAVIIKAQEMGAILISLNGDFSDIVAYPPDRFLGIIAIQLRNHPETIPVIIQRLQNYLRDHLKAAEFKHKLIIVEAHRIRVRA